MNSLLAALSTMLLIVVVRSAPTMRGADDSLIPSFQDEGSYMICKPVREVFRRKPTHSDRRAAVSSSSTGGPLAPLISEENLIDQLIPQKLRLLIECKGVVFAGKCFTLLEDEKKTAHGAEEACRALGSNGRLFEPADHQTLGFVYNYVRTTAYAFVHDSQNSVDVWTGFSYENGQMTTGEDGRAAGEGLANLWKTDFPGPLQSWSKVGMYVQKHEPVSHDLFNHPPYSRFYPLCQQS